MLSVIILHLSMCDGSFWLWGEQDCAAKDKALPSSRYDAGIKGLRAALKLLAPDIRILKSNTAMQTLWLPSRGDAAIPSSPLIGSPPDLRRKVAIKPHIVLARKLSVAELLELVNIANSETEIRAGILFGSSFLWCDRLVFIALNMKAKENFLPGLVRCDGSYEARWLPVPDANDECSLDALALCLPGVCCCMEGRCIEDIQDTPPETHPAQTMNLLLACLLDAMLRQANISEPNISESIQRKNQHHASLHDAWMAALVSADATVQWKNNGDLQGFAHELNRWRRPVDVVAQSPFNFAFRLTAPDDAAGEDAVENGAAGIADAWRVDYLLQPKSDPSLMLPLAELWQAGGRAAAHLKEFGSDATEFLLTALGQAAGLCPAIAASLKSRNPDGFSCDAAGACHFLQEQAQALRAAGFVVLLPSWWVGRGVVQHLQITARAKTPAMQGGGGLTLDSMIQFDVAASLGGETFDLAELRRLALLKAPLVQVRGQWTMIDSDEIKRAVLFLERQQQQSGTARDLIGMALGAEKQVGDLPVAAVETEGWLEQLLATLTGKQDFAVLHQPDRFTGRLRPYQERGYSWLAFLRQWGLGACLADDMGLGKTIQTLALIQQQREAGEQRPVLLACPTSVINNWRKEAARFTPNLSVLVHHGAGRKRKDAFARAATKHGLVISSYGLLQRDVDFMKDVDWVGVILDEAQNIKNPESKQSKAARSIRAHYRIALTGTPVENHVGDLWALMDFLNPGLLGSQNSFKRVFYKPIQVWRDADAAARLKQLTAPFILRRMKTDRSIISDLPDKIEQKAYCTLTREQASLYQAVIEDMQQRLEQATGIERRGLVLATLSKLKQVCNHPAQFMGDGSATPGRSGKLARLHEILEEIREVGERTLVFTQFTTMGGILQGYFQEQFGEEVLFLHGGVNRKKRDAMIERFQQDEDAPRLFILSLKAGGTGLNLTRANHVVHYDRWWNPAVENQATDRAFRIGQQRNVQVHKFIVAGTLEERIDEMIEQKTGVAAQVIGSGEQWLTELSNDDLRDMIRLSRDAVGE